MSSLLHTWNERRARSEQVTRAAAVYEPKLFGWHLGPAVAEGRGAGADVQTLDDEMVAEGLRRRTGAQADFLLQAVAQWRGTPRRISRRPLPTWW